MRERDPQLVELVKGLDAQSQGWWREFATIQDWRDIAIDPWRQPIKVEDVLESVERVKYNIAARLYIVLRAAVEVGLVTPGK